MTESLSRKPSAVTMRDRAETFRAKGWIRNSFWLSPDAIAGLDIMRDHMGTSSREATINALLERVRRDVSIQQELMAVAT